jgi:hypothetical protein
MKKEIYDVKDKLYYESILLRQEASKEPEYNKSMKLRKKQDDLYKKWIYTLVGIEIG